MLNALFVVVVMLGNTRGCTNKPEESHYLTWLDAVPWSLSLLRKPKAIKTTKVTQEEACPSQYMNRKGSMGSIAVLCYRQGNAL